MEHIILDMRLFSQLAAIGSKNNLFFFYSSVDRDLGTGLIRFRNISHLHILFGDTSIKFYI